MLSWGMSHCLDEGSGWCLWAHKSRGVGGREDWRCTKPSLSRHRPALGMLGRSRYAHFDPLRYNNWWSALLSHLGVTGPCHNTPLMQHMVVWEEVPWGLMLASIFCGIKTDWGNKTENLLLHFNVTPELTEWIWWLKALCFLEAAGPFIVAMLV